MLNQSIKDKLKAGNYEKPMANDLIRALDLGGYVTYKGKEIFVTNEQAREIEKKTGKVFNKGKLC